VLKPLKDKVFAGSDLGDGCQVSIDPVHGLAVTGSFMGKLNPGTDVEFRVHMCEMGLYRPPGNK
jgi:hypothetical protein